MNNSIKIEKALLNKLKFKHLSLLVEIDRFQNVLQAAKELNTTQPAASKMLQEIEDILDVRLFERGPTGVKTTEYGRIMVARARHLIGGVRHASNEILSTKEGQLGQVTIGTLLAAAPALLPSAVTALKSQHPELVVSIQDGTNESLLSALVAEDIDLAISRMETYVIQKELVHEVLYEDKMCVVARPEHAKANSRKITLTELADYQWILPGPDTTLREEFNRIFTEAGVKPPSSRVVESVSLHMNLALLLKTDMVTFLPFHAVQPYVRLGLLTHLDTEFRSVYGPIGVTYRDFEALSPAARLMLDCLKKEAEKLN